MKPVREFLAERAAAQHCAQLIQRGPSPAELLPMLTRAGERLARLLGGALAPLMGPATAELQAAPAERTTIEDLTGQIAPLADMMRRLRAQNPALVGTEREHADHPFS